MKTADIQALPAPPSLIDSLMAGFNATADHIDLVLIPILLDLFLWFGPHLRISKFVDKAISTAVSQSGTLGSESLNILETGRQFWASATERLNLFSSLRSFPVGVPSLMGTSQPLSTPVGSPVFIDTQSLGVILLLWLLITLIGLGIGTFYFSIVSQAAISGEVSWRSALSSWPWEAFQIFLLSFLWMCVLILLSIPASCLFTTIALSGMQFGNLALLLYAGMVLWILIPLFFSPFGIFLFKRKMLESVKDSIRVTRFTLVKTILFLMVIFLVDIGFTILWQVPEDVSWLAIVGIIGHAFIATGSLAACFVYFRDASRWSQRLIQQAALSSRA